MSVYSMTPRTQSGIAVSLGRLGRAVSNLHLSLRDWNDRRITRRVLRSLTDRQLADIGLHRGDLDGLS